MQLRRRWTTERRQTRGDATKRRRAPCTGSGRVVELRTVCAPSVQRALDEIGRTEDIKLSPTGKRLAIVAFNRDCVLLLDIAMQGRHLVLPQYQLLVSEAFHRPHGIDFLDESTIVVGNRGGQAVVINLPGTELDGATHAVTPALTLTTQGIDSKPASVAARRMADGSFHILACHNATHVVTRHVCLMVDNLWVEHSVKQVVQRELQIPDGVAVSVDDQWLAISNHDARNVMVYRLTPELDTESAPDCILAGVDCPHGLDFTADGRHLLVADAAAPYLHVYRSDGDWSGVHHPVGSVRILSDEEFLQCQANPEEGGQKGLDIDTNAGIVVTTSEAVPLRVFDLAGVLGADQNPDAKFQQESDRFAVELAMRRLTAQRFAHTAASQSLSDLQSEIAAVHNSKSWRLTQPLRTVADWLQQVRARLRR